MANLREKIRNSLCFIILTLLLLVACLVALVEDFDTSASALDTRSFTLEKGGEVYAEVYYPESFVANPNGVYAIDQDTTDLKDYFRLYLTADKSEYNIITYSDGLYSEPYIAADTREGQTCYYLKFCYIAIDYYINLSNGVDTVPFSHNFNCFDIVSPSVVANSLDPAKRKLKIVDRDSDEHNFSLSGLKSVKIYTSERVFYENTSLGGVSSYEVDFGDTNSIGFRSDVYIRIEDVAGNVTEELLWTVGESPEYRDYINKLDVLDGYINYKDENGIGLSDAIVAQLRQAVEEVEESFSATGIAAVSEESKAAMDAANRYVNEGYTLDDCLTLEVPDEILLPSTSVAYYYKDVKYGDQVVLSISYTDASLSADVANMVRTYIVTLKVNGEYKQLANGVSIYCDFPSDFEVVELLRGDTPVDYEVSKSDWIRYTVGSTGVYQLYYNTESSELLPWWAWLLIAVGIVIVVGTAVAIVIVKVKSEKKS